ncbi:Uncharacterised protein [Mycobacteroides abscessus subsp. abscessus]|nr:Uncharacterised protein [Mycobacteroides abscessus subsp. abscessus]
MPNRKSTASAWPTGSMSRMVADLVSGTKTAVSTKASTHTGRLIQNTARQPTHWINNPPTIGPSAIDMPTTAPQNPSALARSTRPVKTCEMMESATGFSIDPPTAWSRRAAMSSPTVGATLQSSEPIAKIDSPR